MKVLNSSPTTYVHFEVAIKPGVTPIPKNREESVREMIKKYANFLSEVEGGAPGSGPTNVGQSAQIASLQAELLKANTQVSKLQKLLTKDQDPKAVANRKAHEAEERATAAEARVTELEGLLTAATAPKSEAAPEAPAATISEADPAPSTGN